jgi:hypothetical protein
MGFPMISVGGSLPPFHNGMAQGIWAEPVFSFWLNRDADASVGGEMVLGGINPAHFTGEHTWCARARGAACVSHAVCAPACRWSPWPSPACVSPLHHVARRASLTRHHTTIALTSHLTMSHSTLSRT